MEVKLTRRVPALRKSIQIKLNKLSDRNVNVYPARLNKFIYFLPRTFIAFPVCLTQGCAMLPIPLIKSSSCRLRLKPLKYFITRFLAPTCQRAACSFSGAARPGRRGRQGSWACSSAREASGPVRRGWAGAGSRGRRAASPCPGTAGPRARAPPGRAVMRSRRPRWPPPAAQRSRPDRRRRRRHRPPATPSARRRSRASGSGSPPASPARAGRTRSGSPGDGANSRTCLINFRNFMHCILFSAKFCLPIHLRLPDRAVYLHFSDSHTSVGLFGIKKPEENQHCGKQHDSNSVITLYTGPATCPSERVVLPLTTSRD